MMVDDVAPSHPATGHGIGFWLLSAAIVIAALYVVGVRRLRRHDDRWPISRCMAAAGAVACLTVAALPVLGSATTFPAHVVAHLVTTMLAPLLLALSVPITLALRTVGAPWRRLLVRGLHSRPARVLSRPAVIVILSVGGMYALYLTPLYEAALQATWMTAVIHLHMFLTGFLLCWYLAGLDPAPRRRTTATAIGVLVAVAAGHGILAKLLYAQLLPTGAGPPEHIQRGAELLYYGGGAVELVLAVVVLGGWYRRGGRLLLHEEARHRARPLNIAPHVSHVGHQLIGEEGALRVGGVDRRPGQAYVDTEGDGKPGGAGDDAHGSTDRVRLSTAAGNLPVADVHQDGAPRLPTAGELVTRGRAERR